MTFLWKIGMGSSNLEQFTMFQLSFSQLAVDPLICFPIAFKTNLHFVFIVLHSCWHFAVAVIILPLQLSSDVISNSFREVLLQCDEWAWWHDESASCSYTFQVIFRIIYNFCWYFCCIFSFHVHLAHLSVYVHVFIVHNVHLRLSNVHVCVCVCVSACVYVEVECFGVIRA